jgi:hypothetical protein
MTRLVLDISMSLDGFVAGPNPSLEQPLGEGGDRRVGLRPRQLARATRPYRRRDQPRRRGPPGIDRRDGRHRDGQADVQRRGRRVGRRPACGRLVGDEPPFRVPVFVLTHHARESVAKQGETSYTFVTDGIEAALEQARAAAGDKDVALGWGRERRSAVLEGRAARRAADPPRSRASRRGHPPLRPYRPDRARGHEGDRVPLRHPSQVQGREITAALPVIHPLGTAAPRPATGPSLRRRTLRASRARYWISVSSLNMGRYIAMITIPTMIPTPIIMSGSMIDVRLAIALSTSSS